MPPSPAESTPSTLPPDAPDTPSSSGPTLGEFLRAHRERLRPADFGLPPGLRRRAPGLRREEVATLCGISPTWYTWIEQGRSTAISVETLGNLATGLRLSQAERHYLFQLASRADPAPAPHVGQAQAQQLAPLVQAVRSPAYVLDRHWDACTWNKAAASLFTHWLGRPAAGADQPNPRRNLLRYVFLDPRAQHFIHAWPERAERLVAEFRADTAAWSEDPVRQALVDDLCRASTVFRSAWQAQRVLSREGGLRRFHLNNDVLASFEQFTLKIAQHPGLLMTVLVPQTASEAP